MLAVACDENLVLAGFVFAADRGCMALYFTWMPARFLRFTASLLTSPFDVFTVTWTMALLAAEMGTASQLVSAHLTAPDFCQPTRLVLERLLSAHARLLC